MPNNAEARRQKKKDNRKSTVPAPLHKVDKASVDILSLSLAGKDKPSADSPSLSLTGRNKASVDIPSLSLASKVKASANTSSSLSLTDSNRAPDGETLRRDALREKYAKSLSQAERLEKIAQVRKVNSGASEGEIRALYRAHLSDEALKAQDLEEEQRQEKRKQATKRFNDEAQQDTRYILALDKMGKAIQENVHAVYDEEVDWIWAKQALVTTHGQSMTQDENTAWRKQIRRETKEANPGLQYEEIKAHAKRAMIWVALEWHRNDVQRIKDSSLSLAGTDKSI